MFYFVENSFWEEIWIAVVPAFIAAVSVIIGYFVNKRMQNKRSYMDFVTQDRMKWMSEMKEKYAELSSILWKFELNHADHVKMNYLIDYICISVNPDNYSAINLYKILIEIKDNWKQIVHNVDEKAKKNLIKVYLNKLQIEFWRFIKTEWDVIKLEVQHGKELKTAEKLSKKEEFREDIYGNSLEKTQKDKIYDLACSKMKDDFFSVLAQQTKMDSTNKKDKEGNNS